MFFNLGCSLSQNLGLGFCDSKYYYVKCEDYTKQDSTNAVDQSCGSNYLATVRWKDLKWNWKNFQ